jgi:hypothetical protein
LEFLTDNWRMMMTVRTRIHWTDEERSVVFNRMVEVYAEGRSSSRENILIKAQYDLPIGRRRKVYPAMLANLKSWMESARAESYSRVRDRKLTEVALADKVEAPAPQPVELGNSELLEKLFDQLAKRVAIEVMSGISEQLSALQKTHQNNLPAVNQTAEARLFAQQLASASGLTPKPRRKRVTIIGLRGQQMSVIKQKYQDIDFTFLDVDDAVGRVPCEAECTIMMTKFINHSVYAKYRNAPNMRHCNGGISDLGSIIQDIRNS